MKKASALKKELRVRLLETQRERQRTRVRLQRVRSDFEREERARRRLEETHKFLTDLEILREEVDGSDHEQEDERLSNGQKGHAKVCLNEEREHAAATVLYRIPFYEPFRSFVLDWASQSYRDRGIALPWWLCVSRCCRRSFRHVG